MAAAAYCRVRPVCSRAIFCSSTRLLGDTILDQREVGGLQIQRNDEWFDVDLVPGTFVVNLGEMLARWTNDVFRATPHRVLNKSGRERYTIPFFFGTHYDTWIEWVKS